METKEIWKDIPGYEGLYQVSNKGNVKSLNYRRTGKEKILKTYKKKNGYLFTSLYISGVSKNYHIHRLVACVFNNFSLKTDLTVNHKDGNKENNNIQNLELCTMKENSIHAVNNNLKPKGSKVGTSKLNEQKVKEIKKLLNDNTKVTHLAIKYNISRSVIIDIKYNRTWKHV